MAMTTPCLRGAVPPVCPALSGAIVLLLLVSSTCQAALVYLDDARLLDTATNIEYLSPSVTAFGNPGNLPNAYALQGWRLAGDVARDLGLDQSLVDDMRQRYFGPEVFLGPFDPELLQWGTHVFGATFQDQGSWINVCETSETPDLSSISCVRLSGGYEDHGEENGGWYFAQGRGNHWDSSWFSDDSDFWLNVEQPLYARSVVPVPAAAWLFASALGVMGWMRRRGS